MGAERVDGPASRADAPRPELSYDECFAWASKYADVPFSALPLACASNGDPGPMAVLRSLFAIARALHDEGEGTLPPPTFGRVGRLAAHYDAMADRFPLLRRWYKRRAASARRVARSEEVSGGRA